MISKVWIKNFKCLRDVQIELEQLTVFVGPNASGKSSILLALDYLCRTFREERDLDDELNNSLSRGAMGRLELAGEVGGRWYRYRSRGQTTPPPTTRTHAISSREETDLDAADWQPWKPPTQETTPLPRSVMLSLETSRLRNPSGTSNPTVMSPDGTGLHSALASMTLNDPDTWQRLQADLRRLLPTIQRLRHSKPPNSALLFDTVGGDSLSARDVSEGTLLVLGLLTALHAPERPNLMLLDDLDRGLHPRAQRELVSLLRGLLETNPALQIIATTHSPYLLDRIEPKEVRMTYLENGATVCASLTEHPKFERWKDEFHPGEMWSVFGEDWLVKQEVAR